MKKLAFLWILVCWMGISSVQAQRVAYVDLDQIMAELPAYATAQKELEETAEKWRQEIAKEYEAIDQMRRDYQTREPLMSDESRKEAKDKLVAKESAVRELQKKRFGPDGELFKKRQSLVKPIQEKVYKTVEKLAKERNYDFIFSAPNGSTVVYAKPDKDLTQEVIKRLKRN